MPSRKPSTYAPSYSPRGRGGYRAPTSPERRSVSVLLVLLAAMAALAAFGWLQSRSAGLPGGARLLVAAGTVSIERPGAGAQPPLAAGQEAPLQRGDALRVSGDGRAVLALGQAGSVEFGPGTHVALLDLVQKPFARAVEARLALHAGSVLGRLVGEPAGDAGLIIETTAVAVAMEGGVVLCQALTTNHSQVAVYEGSAGVSMGEQSAQLGPGEGVDVQLGQPFAPVAVLRPAPTPVVIPRETAVAATATLTDREKTLFPRVLTPTRPGDPPAATDPPAGDGTTVWYTVAKGDTLYSIARQYGVSWEVIWEANKETLPKPEMLQVGQQLRIPSP